MKEFRFQAIRAQQADGRQVLCFAATPEQVLSFAEIERVGRSDDGTLRGFQRHQVASHIREIRDYLARADALLPNAVIVAFIDGITVSAGDEQIVDVEIRVGDERPGFVVDGQQRLSALSGVDKPGFQVFVSVLICKDYNELRQQFVLINNTRPLPKSLIYELLPTVEGLPERFTARKFSARVVDRLNFTRGSSLFGAIKQHTNPKGVISDTALQKLVMNSASDGAIRQFLHCDDYEDRAVSLIDEFFRAVSMVFAPEWIGMSPKTSRLKHGAGVVAMGFVMELIHSSDGATTCEQFLPALGLLKGHTAWSTGTWQYSEDDHRPWHAIQNTPTDIDQLAKYLTRTLRQQMKLSRQSGDV